MHFAVAKCKAHDRFAGPPHRVFKSENFSIITLHSRFKKNAIIVTCKIARFASQQACRPRVSVWENLPSGNITHEPTDPVGFPLQRKQESYAMLFQNLLHVFKAEIGDICD